MNGQVNRSRVGKPEADAQRVADERNAPDCARLSGRGHGGEAGSPASPLRDRAPAKPATPRRVAANPPPSGLSSFHGHNSVTCENLMKCPSLVMIHSYPDGSFSGVASMRHGRKREDGQPGESVWSGLSQDERDAENLQRSNRRAMQDMKRHVRHGDLRRLLTFTNGGEGQGWTTLREAALQTLEWYRTEGRELLGETAFVCVPERGGGNGRIHVHAAIRKGYRLDYSRIIASWSSFLTAKGFISSASCHRWHAGDDQGRGANGFSSARVCAGYLAKYLTKGFESEPRAKFEKRYRTAGSIVPEPRRIHGLSLAEVPIALGDTFGGRVSGGWYEDEDGRYGGWWFEVDPP
jgi:hypothetical protein